MCEFNHLFITEDIVEGGGFLDYIILRCVFLSLIIFCINFLECKMSENCENFPELKVKS